MASEAQNGYSLWMDKQAEQLIEEALKRVKLDDSFSPAEIGQRVGMTRLQAESAARMLSDAGVLVLGFDCAAEFSADFRKSRTRVRKKSRAAG